MARVVARAGRDGHVILAAALIVPVLVIQVTTGLADWSLVAGLATGYVVLQVAVGRLTRSSRTTAVDVIRLGLALLFVTIVSRLGNEGDGTPPVLVLTVPVVALAATHGGRQALAIGGLALVGYGLTIVLNPAPTDLAAERVIVLAAVAIVLSVGARRTVSSLERALESVRAAMAADRRRSRQLAGVEEVGSLLARAGPTDDALGGVMDLLAERFGYRHASIYLGDHRHMALGAHVGHDQPIAGFGPTQGVLGRVMRTRAAAFVPDVATDPDYLPAGDDIASLISVPLVVGAELIGVINVETSAPERLDGSDLAAMRLVADRLAAALALSRERDRLGRRVRAFESLTTFAQSLTATLEPAELYERIPGLVTAVLPADSVTLTIRQADGSYRIVALPGGDERFVGTVIEPGEGMSGRAIGEGGLVVAERYEHDRPPRALGPAHAGPPTAVASFPLLSPTGAVGAITLARFDPPTPFDELEREVLPLIGSQAALAIVNAQLHHAATEASIRDPLTGLYNRRHLDAFLERLSAARRRPVADGRRPLSVVMFDLDHFGQFNKRHGHAVGDEVLRVFGRILRERARASDLLARYGGEEFLVVLDGATRDEAVGYAEDVRRRLASVTVKGAMGESLTASVSAGCAGLDPDATDFDGLLEAADAGLALAKKSGRDRVVAA